MATVSRFAFLPLWWCLDEVKFSLRGLGTDCQEGGPGGTLGSPRERAFIEKDICDSYAIYIYMAFL